MAAPSISGYSILMPPYSFANAATGPYPSDNGVAFNLVTNGSSNTNLRGSTGSTSGSLVVGQDTTSFALDLTSKAAIFFNVLVSSGNAMFAADSALQFGWADSADAYQVFNVGGADIFNADGENFADFPIVIQSGSAPDASSGVIDLSDIDTLFAGFRVTGANNLSPNLFFSVGTIDTELTIEGGEVGDEGSFVAMQALAAVLPSTLLRQSQLPGAVESSKQFLVLTPLRIRAQVFASFGEYLRFLSATSFLRAGADYYSLVFDPPNSTSIQTLDAGGVSSDTSVDIEVATTAHASATLSVTDVTFNCPGTTTWRSPGVLSGGVSTGRTLFEYVSGSVTNHTLGANTPLLIDCTPGDDLSAVRFILSGANPVLRLNPSAAGASAIDLPGLQAAGEIDIRNDTAHAITITLAAGTSYTTANNSGGAVIVQVPTASITVAGIPNVENAILWFYEVETDTTSYPALTGGSATITVNPSYTYVLRADAPGYLASRFITISGGTPEYEFSLEDYRALYDQGVNRSADIQFNPTTLEITITDGLSQYSFADVFRTLEDYLATPQGLQYTAHPYPVVLRDRNIIRFPYDSVQNQVNPAKVMPDPTNSTDPELLFEVDLEGATDTTYDLFDFSQAGGRILRVRSAIAIAQLTVQGDGSFTSSDREVLGRAVDLLEADEEIAPDRYQKLLAGSSTVLIDKDVAKAGGNVSITEHSP